MLAEPVLLTVMARGVAWLARQRMVSTIIMLSTMARISLLALGWTLAEADNH